MSPMGEMSPMALLTVVGGEERTDPTLPELPEAPTGSTAPSLDAWCLVPS